MPAATVPPAVLALDFDGVLCDGLREYFQSSWQAYLRTWPVTEPVPPAGLAQTFYGLRPVVESGWEMPLVLRAVLRGYTTDDICRRWPAIARGLLECEGVTTDALRAALDAVRDEWIARDRAGWLASHRFYPGVIERLRALAAGATRPYIVSTKEGRFVRELVAQQGVTLAETQIIGKEAKRPKREILKALLAAGAPSLWFVEDRLETLESVKQEPVLDAVRLFLAEWGYNTPAERDAARGDARVRLLALGVFAQDFPAWSS